MNTQYREKLQGTDLDYYNAPAAVDAIQPGAWAKLPYTSRVLAEQLVRRCQPEKLTASLEQLIYRKRDLDFPWYPDRKSTRLNSCHVRIWYAVFCLKKKKKTQQPTHNVTVRVTPQ